MEMAKQNHPKTLIISEIELILLDTAASTSNLRLSIFVFFKLKKSITEQIYKTYHKKGSE